MTMASERVLIAPMSVTSLMTGLIPPETGYGAPDLKGPMALPQPAATGVLTGAKRSSCPRIWEEAACGPSRWLPASF